MSEHPAGRETALGAAGSPPPAQEGDGTERADGPGETVGASDAAADAARSGADVDVPDDVRTDTDPVPVGDDDADADARRSGGHR